MNKHNSKFFKSIEMKFSYKYDTYRFNNIILNCIKTNIPLVIRNLVPDKLRSNWQDLNYLTNKVGSAPIPVELYNTNSYYEIDKSQVILLSLKEYVEYLKSPTKERKMYLAEIELYNRNKKNSPLERLNDDISYLQIYPSKSLYNRVLFLGYNSMTQMHYHPRHEAIINQVMGVKRLFLFPPDINLFYQMKPYPWYHTKINWSQHIFKTESAIEFKKLYKNFNFNDGVEVLLYPGDSLYIPIYWWHIVFSEGISLAFTDFFETSFSKKYLSFIGFRSLNYMPNYLKHSIQSNFSRVVSN